MTIISSDHENEIQSRRGYMDYIDISIFFLHPWPPGTLKVYIYVDA